MYFRNQLILPILLLSAGAIASEPVIYGVDNRVDPFQSTSTLHKNIAKSTAAHVHKDQIRFFVHNADLIGPSLAEGLNLCKDQRFAHQPMVSNCSGTLVGPDIIATAGHCIMSWDDCADYYWVFNFKVRNARQGRVAVRSRDVYRCKEILESKMTATADFALLKLDRPVRNTVPVMVASKKPRAGTPVFTVGHPSGLPQKISDNAVVRSVGRFEFKANLDTFDKGSGSGVFHGITGEMLGILVRGAQDFKDRPSDNCKEVNVIPDESEGEDVSAVTQFYKYLPNTP